MYDLSEHDAKERALEYLKDDHIQNPRETATKSDDLCDFWMGNPPEFTRGKSDDWPGWKEFRLIDPEVDDEGIDKMSVDMARYYVERSETDYDYWDALCQIVEKTLDSSPCVRRRVIDNPWLCGWLSDRVVDRRTAPRRKPGNRTRKYHTRNGCIYFAMQALCDEGPMTQDAAAQWVSSKVHLSKEAILTIYREACTS